VALGALPQQLGAAIPAAPADVRIEVEDRLAGELDVAADQGGRKAQGRERFPDFLVNGQTVGMVGKRVQQAIEGGLVLPGGRQMA
jgi:hypothetical protein